MDYQTQSDSQVSSQISQDKSEHLYGTYEQEFTFQKKQKRFQQMSFLLNCLKNHFIFYNLSQTQLENVAKKMYYCIVPSESFVFKEGYKSMWFFIIQKGMMHAISQGKVKKQLRIGDGFGEIALLYKTPRTFSVKACESCCLWGIDRNTFRKAVEQIIIKEYEQNKIFMENIKFFRNLSIEHKDAIAGSLVPQQYSKGQIIVNEGDPGSTFYVIKEGQASLWKGNRIVKKLRKGDTFGEQSLYYNTVRQMSVKSEGQLKCLILSRQTIHKVLGDQIFIVTFRNFIKRSIQKSTFLSKLNKEEIQKIIDLMRITTYKAGSIVIRKNPEGRLPLNQKVIIIIEGALKKSNNIYPIATRSQIYGEQFLLHNRTKNRYDDDLIMQNNGVLAEIKADLIKDIIGGKIDIIVGNREKQLQMELKQKARKRQKNMIKCLKDLTLLKQLNKNTYGFNLLVACQKESQHQLYFMKCIKKAKIQNQALFNYKLEESKLLKNLMHPFIVEGYKYFQDNDYLYDLTQFIRGQEFYDVIREIGLLSSEDSQFYIGSIILIMEYLCEEGLYLRDIKPQMFMVDMEGYLLITDIVSIKNNKDKDIRSKTNTMIGTPHYMAPQIILNKGYNFTCSLYSLGVLLYEIMCGYVPFGEKTEDPLQIYEDVLNSELKFPKNLKDAKARRLMEQLLNKQNPQGRLGGPTISSLKIHPWFYKMDWDDLYEKKIPPPVFERFPNLEESEEDLVKFMKHGKNCYTYIEQIQDGSQERDQSSSVNDSKFNEW